MPVYLCDEKVIFFLYELKNSHYLEFRDCFQKVFLNEKMQSDNTLHNYIPSLH